MWKPSALALAASVVLGYSAAPREGEGGTDRLSRAGNGPRSALEPAMLYPFPPACGSSSPWGLIQAITPLGPDALAVTTASHGAIRVSLAALAPIPEPLRETAFSGAGWFEEDCDWCIPYLVLGLDAFQRDVVRGAECRAAARTTLARFHPGHAGLVQSLLQAEGGHD